MKRYCFGVICLVLLGGLPITAAAEWKSEPPEVMSGGEIIGQFYHLFSDASPPHMVWVKYDEKFYLCRGEDIAFQCQETAESIAAGGVTDAPPASQPTPQPAP